MKREQIVFNRGFRITEDGILLNSKGVKRGTTKCNGYYVVKLRIGDRSSVAIKVHRLQAFQKYGLKLYEQGIVVRHRNGNKEDNSWGNILIGTQSDNMMDIPEQQRIQHAKLASSYLKKYDNEAIKLYHLRTKSYKKTMQNFGITSKGTLNYILRG